MWFGWLPHQRWSFMHNAPHTLGTYRHLSHSVLNMGCRGMAYSNDRLTVIRTICSHCLLVVCGCHTGISARALAAATILAVSRGGGVFSLFFWWLPIATKKTEIRTIPPTTSYAETTGLPWRRRRAPRQWARSVSSEPNLLLIILIPFSISKLNVDVKLKVKVVISNFKLKVKDLQKNF